jgi:basic membrane protein A
MKTLIPLVLGLTILTVVIVMAGQNQVPNPTESRPQADGFRIGLVLDKGGKDDKSFNSAAYEGLMRVKNELKPKEGKLLAKFVEATDDNAFESLLRAFAQKNFDLIISIGVSQVDAMRKVAAKFPDRHFVIVDGEVIAPNVRSLLFEEHEGSFLVGAIAALTSQTGKVGFIGGMDIPLIKRFETGYVAGAKLVNPKTTVLTHYVGVTAEAWNNPAKAKELAVTQYDSGVDVVFSASGASGTGVFDAAEEQSNKLINNQLIKKYAIGVDSNQNWVKPGVVLTSMVKRVDEAVFSACKDAFEGNFTAGTKRFGLDNQGVDYTVDSYNMNVLTPEVRKRAEIIKADIISGKVKVPDYYKIKK